MSSKTVLLIPADKETSDIAFLETSFRKVFNFDKQVNLAISFQRLDSDFDEPVDLDDGDELCHLDKLNVVVTPVLVTPPAVRNIKFIYRLLLKHGLFCRVLYGELEMILDNDNGSGESRERWKEVCSAILKQGDLESARISKAMANFSDSYGEYILYTIRTCMYLYAHACPFFVDDFLKAFSILPYLLPDVRTKVNSDKFITVCQVFKCV